MRNRGVAPGFSDRRNRRKNKVALPDGGPPDRSAHKTLSDGSGSGPTGSPERSPLSVWNSPEPAAVLAFGKAASRPVNPARLITWPGFGKALSGAKSAPPKTSLSAGRENAQTAGRLPRPPLRFPATSPVNPTRRMENQKKEPPEKPHPQAGRGLVPACSGRRDRGLSFVRSCFLADAKKQGWGLTPGLAAGGAGHIFFTPLRSVKKIPGCPLRWDKTRASPGPPWPVLSRVLRRRHLISARLSDAIFLGRPGGVADRYQTWLSETAG